MQKGIVIGRTQSIFSDDDQKADDLDFFTQTLEVVPFDSPLFYLNIVTYVLIAVGIFYTVKSVCARDNDGDPEDDEHEHLSEVSFGKTPTLEGLRQRRGLQLKDPALIPPPIFAPADTKGVSPLITAARAGEEFECQKLLQSGFEVDTTDQFGCTALHGAASLGAASVAKTLIEHGACVDARDCWEETPLHHGARAGMVEVMKTLLEKNAELNSVNSDDFTPLVLAAKASQEAACDFLLKRGATVGGAKDEDLTPLLVSQLVRQMITPKDPT